MQQFRNERTPLSVGEIAVVVVDFIFAALTAATLWLLLREELPPGQSPVWLLVAGLAFACVGVLVAAVCLLLRKPLAARCFQMVGAMGGLSLVLYLVALAMWDSVPGLDVCLAFGVPAAVLIGSAVYVGSITRRGAVE